MSNTQEPPSKPSGQKQKRNRLAASCSVCRKRKSKCDKAKPVCGSCIKKSIAHLCHYETHSSKQRLSQNYQYQQDYQQQQLHQQPNLPQHQQPLQQQHQLPQHTPHPPPAPPFYNEQYNSPGPLNQQQQPPLQSSSSYQKGNSRPTPHFQQPPLHPQYPIPPSPFSSDPMNHSTSNNTTNGINNHTYNSPHNHSHQHHMQPPPLPVPQPPPPPAPLHSHSSYSSNHQPSPSASLYPVPGQSPSYSSLPNTTKVPPQLPIPNSTNSNRNSQDNGKPKLTSPPKSSFKGYQPPTSSSSINSLPLPQPPSGPSSITATHNNNHHIEHRNSSSRLSIPSPNNFMTNASPTGNNFMTPPLTKLKSINADSGITPPNYNNSNNNGNNNNNNNTNNVNNKAGNAISSPASYSLGKTPSIQSNNSPNYKDSISSNPLVSIPLGPNSSLQISPDDRINVFSNASLSLSSEGPNGQLQGYLSYIGLTKLDPFITILRNFLVHLFKTGEMAVFIESDNTRKRRNSNGSLTSGRRSLDYSSPAHKKSKVGQNQTSPMEGIPGLSDGDSGKNEGGGDLNKLSKTAINNLRTEANNSLNISSPIDDFSPNNLVTGAGNNNSNNASNNNNQLNNESQPTINIPTFELTLLATNDKKQYYSMVEKYITSILPDQYNSFQLFCRFFKYVYPFVPIIDENSLIVDVKNLLKNFPAFSHEKWNNLKIKNDNDLRTLGIFLLILKLGYMTLIHNDNVYNDYNEKELSIIENMKPITSTIFRKAIDLCIGNSLNASKSSFKLVQLLSLLYFYKENAPDDGHGICGADSQILLGITIRHALSIGLNRDPTTYLTHDVITKNPGLIKTWRYLWYYIIGNDAVSSIHNGTNLNLMNLDISDVHIPYESKDKSGQLNEFIKKTILIYKYYRQLVSKICNMSVKPKVMDILSDTNNLERIFFEFFGKDFFKVEICKPAKINPKSEEDGWEVGSIEHEETFMKVMKYCIFIQLRTNLSGLYYMIAIHYENEYNESKTPSMNAGIELFKIYIKSVVQIVYIMSYVLDNSVELFGKHYDYILTSANERYMNKTHSFLTSFFVRLLHQKKDLSFKVFKEPSFIPRLEVMDTLFTMVLIEAELFVGNFKKLSRTYINSYRLYIMTYIILRQCVENPDVFFEKAISDQSFFHQGTNMIEFFTIAELQHLCKLCSQLRNAKDEQNKLKAERLKAKGIILNDHRGSYENNDLLNLTNHFKNEEGTNEYFNIDEYKEDDLNLFGLDSSFGGGSSTSILSFFDDDKIFNNLNNLNDNDLDPMACNEDLIRLFNIYGDFDGLLGL
ncbi:uncharacterized protein KGF55_002250 [Candida pseudojiufengensis]|uniref:uncharacterized protein n=1 Tax=Candida pseudojiufengensis TaxID=497109 RepID=UPI002224F647|nr:uncharacterized protein KGF55_002250 [Candida pseudojiufengensis]KAI5964308.1 hypothetical protein KGF55_002250 [Candida pseudojiufengensis]